MQKRIQKKRQRTIEDKVAKGKAEKSEMDEIVSEISQFRELTTLMSF